MSTGLFVGTLVGAGIDANSFSVDESLLGKTTDFRAEIKKMSTFSSFTHWVVNYIKILSNKISVAEFCNFYVNLIVEIM